MNYENLVEKIKYLRKFGGNVLCIGEERITDTIVDKLFLGHSSIFVDVTKTSLGAKELLLEELSYDLIFCTPAIEESTSGLDLMDSVFETHPYANFVLSSDCEAYEELDLEPQQIYLNINSLDKINMLLRD